MRRRGGGGGGEEELDADGMRKHKITRTTKKRDGGKHKMQSRRRRVFVFVFVMRSKGRSEPGPVAQGSLIGKGLFNFAIAGLSPVVCNRRAGGWS